MIRWILAIIVSFTGFSGLAYYVGQDERERLNTKSMEARIERLEGDLQNCQDFRRKIGDK